MTPPEIRGTAEAGSTVEVFDGAVSLGRTLANPQGAWVLTAAVLMNGSHALTAIATDATGNQSSSSNTVSIFIDTSVPSVLTLGPVTADDTLNASEAQGLVAIAGTTAGAPDGSVVSLAVGSTTYTGTVLGGAFSISVAGADLAAATSLSATVTDTAGNVSSPLADGYAVDVTAPVVASIAPVTADNVLNMGEAASSVTIAGTTTGAPDGSIVSLTVGSATYSGTVTGQAFSVAVSGADLAAATSISVIVTDPAGNPSIAGSRAYAIDASAPTVTIAPSNSQVAGGQSIGITFTFSEAVTGFDLADATVANGTLSDLQGTGSFYTATFTPTANLAAGTATVMVGTGYADLAGNTGTAGVSSTPISIDTLAPTVIVTSNTDTLLAGQTAQITFTFSEPVSGFTLADTAVDNGVLSNLTGSGASYTATFTPNAATQAVAAAVSVRNLSYTDIFGNAGAGGTDATPIAVDTLAPTVTITTDDAALNIGDTAIITFTFSEGVSNFTTADITVTNATLSNLNTLDGLIWTATLTPDAGLAAASAVITVANTYTDQLGNSGTSGTGPAIAIDTVAPGVIITSDDLALNAGDTATITFTFSEAVTGFSLADVQVANGSLSGLATTDDVTWTAIFTPVAGLATGSATVAMIASSYTDAAGNTGAAGTGPVMAIDTLAPSITTIASTASGYFNAGDVIPITLTFSEAVTGTVTVTLSSGGTATAWPAATASPWTTPRWPARRRPTWT